MNTITHLEPLARAAGAAGADLGRLHLPRRCADKIVMVLDEAPGRLDLAPVETAYADGRAAWRIASGWRVMWTTAPADYDQFGTTTIETCARRVAGQATAGARSRTLPMRAIRRIAPDLGLHPVF